MPLINMPYVVVIYIITVTTSVHPTSTAAAVAGHIQACTHASLLPASLPVPNSAQLLA
jgi:hypothetical protein